MTSFITGIEFTFQYWFVKKMQLGSAGAVIPLLASGPEMSPAGERGKFNFLDWLIIYSLFMQNLVLSEEFLYKFKLMK